MRTTLRTVACALVVATATALATTTAVAGQPAAPGASPAAATIRPSASQRSQDDALKAFYAQWKSAFVQHQCGNGWYQIYSPDADHPYVGEGQGYGLVITALMAKFDADAHAVFDGLVKYVVDHPSGNNHDLLAAEQDRSCTSVDGSDSATDGDLDVAFGLLLGDKVWGSTGGTDYKALAVKHINAIKKSEINPKTRLLLLGDWSDSSEEHYWDSRSSDWLIDHFRAFAKATGDADWDAIRSRHQDTIAALRSTYAPRTGLLPDFVQNTNTATRPAQGQVLETPHDGDYDYNACRDPWRIGADAITSGDAKSKAAAAQLDTWVQQATGGNPDRIGNGYKLDGTAYAKDSDPAFWAPFAVTAMASGSQAWLDKLWTKLAATGVDPKTYYGASIQLQVMIIVSGHYLTPDRLSDNSSFDQRADGLSDRR